jgi:hypothetical protein
MSSCVLAYAQDDMLRTGDDLSFRRKWNDKDKPGELFGKHVRFEIKLKEGIHYAIRASLNPSHCEPPILRY